MAYKWNDGPMIVSIDGHIENLRSNLSSELLARNDKRETTCWLIDTS